MSTLETGVGARAIKRVSLVFAFVDGDSDIHVSAGALRGVG